ncbi:MAG: hypothetical protein LBU42_04325 [Prevotellaceae bacterium]|jgi:hypothetical protein|nr:hypothetical protein [Prevotellaceae bacterium]
MGKIKSYFNSYPEADQLYETSDGQVFLEKEKAKTHAQRFKDGKVITHVRGREENTEECPEIIKAQAEEKLRTMDFTEDAKTFEQPELLALAKALGVVTPDNKKATLIAALYEIQSQL